jgi:hypothetical protein
VISTTPEIQQVNGAGFLTESFSPVRLGPLYVSYAQFAQIFDRGSSFNGSGTFQSAASQFSAGIVLDKRFRKFHVAFQYIPRLTILNGRVLNDFLNQDVGADIVFALSPRLTLDLGDRFVYYRSRNAFADIFLSSDLTTGATLQKDFIESPASWLSNSVNASFTYLLSARTKIRITPNYLYATTSGQATATTFPSAQQFGLSAAVQHELTPRSNVSAMYTDQTDSIQGVSSRSTYQTMEAGYSHSFNGGWNFAGSFGLITATLQSGRTWSEAGSASVAKGFRRSRAALAYYRGHTFSGYITQNLSDRIDGSYQQYIGRRWTLGGGGGYFRNVATTNGIWAKYVEGNTSFGLTSTLSVFGTYVRKWQHGDNIAVFSGDTDYLRFGIQWTPRQDLR